MSEEWWLDALRMWVFGGFARMGAWMCWKPETRKTTHTQTTNLYRLSPWASWFERASRNIQKKSCSALCLLSSGFEEHKLSTLVKQGLLNQLKQMVLCPERSSETERWWIFWFPRPLYLLRRPDMSLWSPCSSAVPYYSSLTVFQLFSIRDVCRGICFVPFLHWTFPSNNKRRLWSARQKSTPKSYYGCCAVGRKYSILAYYISSSLNISIYTLLGRSGMQVFTHTRALHSSYCQQSKIALAQCSFFAAPALHVMWTLRHWRKRAQWRKPWRKKWWLKYRRTNSNKLVSCLWLAPSDSVLRSLCDSCLLQWTWWISFEAKQQMVEVNEVLASTDFPDSARCPEIWCLIFRRPPWRNPTADETVLSGQKLQAHRCISECEFRWVHSACHWKAKVRLPNVRLLSQFKCVRKCKKANVFGLCQSKHSTNHTL